MLKIWFMFDNCTFARVHLTSKDDMVRQAVELFKEDGCGGLYVRDNFEGLLKSLCLHGRRLPNKRYGMPRVEIEAWADKVLAEQSFAIQMC